MDPISGGQESSLEKLALISSLPILVSLGPVALISIFLFWKRKDRYPIRGLRSPAFVLYGCLIWLIWFLGQTSLVLILASCHARYRFMAAMASLCASILSVRLISMTLRIFISKKQKDLFVAEKSDTNTDGSLRDSAKSTIKVGNDLEQRVDVDTLLRYKDLLIGEKFMILLGIALALPHFIVALAIDPSSYTTATSQDAFRYQECPSWLGPFLISLTLFHTLVFVILVWVSRLLPVKYNLKQELISLYMLLHVTIIVVGSYLWSVPGNNSKLKDWNFIWIDILVTITAALGSLIPALFPVLLSFSRLRKVKPTFSQSVTSGNGGESFTIEPDLEEAVGPLDSQTGHSVTNTAELTFNTGDPSILMADVPNDKKLDFLLSFPAGENALREFLQSEFSHENLLFYLDVQKLKAGWTAKSVSELPSPVKSDTVVTPLTPYAVVGVGSPRPTGANDAESLERSLFMEKRMRVRRIANYYIRPHGPMQINISSVEIQQIENALALIDSQKSFENVTVDGIFGKAMSNCYSLMSQDSLRRFLDSKICKDLVNKLMDNTGKDGKKRTK